MFVHELYVHVHVVVCTRSTCTMYIMYVLGFPTKHVKCIIQCALKSKAEATPLINIR